MVKNKLHIHPSEYAVNHKDRMAKYGHKAYLVWLTGLSGSGKSTIASAVEKKFFDQGLKTYHLDGDNLRKGLNSDLDFSMWGRGENIRRIAEVGRLFVDSNTLTFAAFISPFQKDRQKVKEIVGPKNFIEVFVDCPIEVCEKRDVKGLYKLAREGAISEFTGISSPYETPLSPDVYLNTAEMNMEDCVETLFDYLRKRI